MKKEEKEQRNKKQETRKWKKREEVSRKRLCVCVCVRWVVVSFKLLTSARIMLQYSVCASVRSNPRGIAL
jgi:hypothetical protein